MRTSRLLLAGAGMAVAVAGTSAFTASNTVPDTIAGYGQGTVTGATVNHIQYVPLSSDNTHLASVIFTLTKDVTKQTATMTLKTGGSGADAGTPVGTSPYSCDLSTWNGTTMTATCDTDDNPSFVDFDTVGLTVAEDDNGAA